MANSKQNIIDLTKLLKARFKNLSDEDTGKHLLELSRLVGFSLEEQNIPPEKYDQAVEFIELRAKGDVKTYQDAQAQLAPIPNVESRDALEIIKTLALSDTAQVLHDLATQSKVNRRDATQAHNLLFQQSFTQAIEAGVLDQMIEQLKDEPVGKMQSLVQQAQALIQSTPDMLKLSPAKSEDS